eukprot:scaffold2657_cov89-Amphora_coffeaeformis.AAC.21
MSRSAYKVKYGTAKYSHRGQPSSASSRACPNSSSSSSSSSRVSQIGTDEVTKEGANESDKNDVSSPSKCPATPGSMGTCFTPVMTPISRGDDGANSMEDEKRRAAATEARRHRRLILTRRQNSNSPRRNTSRRGAPIIPFAGVPGHDTRNTPPTPTIAPPPPRCYPLIQPTIEGVENVATRWKNGWVVAIPTECTYEACLAVRLPPRTNTKQPFGGTRDEWWQQVDQLREITKAPLPPRYQEVKDPYCIVTPGCELRRHPILREVFTPRLYALRPSDVDKESVMHRFNENMEVLERLACKLWPGPILIRLGLSSNNPWTQTPFVLESKPPRIDENNPNNTQAPAFNNFVTLRCPRHPLAVKARKDVASIENSLLVSLPIHHSPQQISTTPSSSADNSSDTPPPAFYCTRARQVASRMAVLDGEDCREVFHVPTCEFGRPCESILWLDGRQRVVTVQSTSDDICNPRMVQAALRQSVSKNTGNRKERMLVQAILSKWKIVSSN